MNSLSILSKTQKVIKSCRTADQLSISYKYIGLAIKQIRKKSDNTRDYEMLMYDTYKDKHKEIHGGNIPPPPRVEWVKI